MGHLRIMNSTNNFIFESKEPDYQTWSHLRAIVGWTPYSVNVYKKVIENSLCFVTAWHHNKIVGMGRLVGDNITSFYIQGIVVEPCFQNRGIGTQIVNHLLLYAKENAAEGASINLFAHKGSEGFYQKCGFSQHPNSTRGAGMSQRL